MAAPSAMAPAQRTAPGRHPPLPAARPPPRPPGVYQADAAAPGGGTRPLGPATMVRDWRWQPPTEGGRRAFRSRLRSTATRACGQRCSPKGDRLTPTTKNRRHCARVSYGYPRRPEHGRRRPARAPSLLSPQILVQPLPPRMQPCHFSPASTRQIPPPATWAAPCPPPVHGCPPSASTLPRQRPPRRRSSATAASAPPRPPTHATSSTR